MRLDKFLANENIGSRKEVGVLVRSGAVTVNGQAVKKADMQIDAEKDEICVNGKPVRYNRFIYLLMNKPAGVLTATRDSRAKTVLDLVPPELRRKDLFPAGRLDKDTTGLLIITDDGDFAHRMLAPKSHVMKRYEAVLDLPAEEADVLRFAEGIESGEDHFAPAKLEIDKDDPRRAWVEIREGKFHQVKRMFRACGKTVVQLRRLSIGALALPKDLEPGTVRVLETKEAALVFERKTTPEIEL
ncbi:MAG: rRNA pseudouridine synthase [Clostridia bacterium]|nr:rRNA pseudouridine synthase [Clostridia bacterium]